MGEALEHKCGIVLAYSLHDTYSMIKDLQHRGKEAAGIAAIGETRIDVLKWVGRVDRFDREDLHKIFPGNDYHTFLAHVRYATKGRKEKEQILADAHPHTTGGQIIDNGGHILILDCDTAMVHNGQVHIGSLDDKIEQELKINCDTRILLDYYTEVGERQLLRSIKGAYVLAIADKEKKSVMVIRDRTGIRMGSLGIKGEKNCVATEDIAIRKNGGKVQGDLEPGAIYYFNPHGGYRKEQVIDRKEVKKSLAYCMFEYLYLASPDSVINGISVRYVRECLGRELAREFYPEKIDFVTYIPRAPEAAARAYAEELDVPFIEVFYKPNADRSFMNSTQDERDNSINSNLHLIPSAIEQIRGKRGIYIDDSIVRGTVVKRVKYLIFNVAKVHESAFFVSYTPQIGIIDEYEVPRGCLDGVDMSPNDNFISRIDKQGVGVRNATTKEISEKVGMSVVYLSRYGLNQVFDQVGLPHLNMCTYCIGGNEPYERRDLLELRKKVIDN